MKYFGPFSDIEALYAATKHSLTLPDRVHVRIAAAGLQSYAEQRGLDNSFFFCPRTASFERPPPPTSGAAFHIILPYITSAARIRKRISTRGGGTKRTDVGLVLHAADDGSLSRNERSLHRLATPYNYGCDLVQVARAEEAEAERLGMEFPILADVATELAYATANSR